MHIFTTFQRLFARHSVTRSALLLLTFLFAATQAAWADPITREQAQQRAAAFLQDCTGSRRLAPVTERRKLSARKPLNSKLSTLNSNSPLYYVFDRGTDEGFIIISGEDKTDAVLGYTDSGSFDYQTLPDNMRAWLDDVEDQIAEVRAGGAVLTSSAVPLHPAIPALITTRWNQGDPYNLTCPNYHGVGRSVTGCVATNLNIIRGLGSFDSCI